MSTYTQAFTKTCDESFDMTFTLPITRLLLLSLVVTLDTAYLLYSTLHNLRDVVLRVLVYVKRKRSKAARTRTPRLDEIQIQINRSRPRGTPVDND